MSTWTLYARLMSSLLSNILLEGLSGKVCPERHLFHRFFVYSSTGFTSDIGLASLALPFGPFSACSNTVKTKFDCWFARQGQTLNGVSSLGSMICCHVVATGLQLERLSSVCMDPLCTADAKTAKIASIAGIGPLHRIHFNIVLSAPPLASPVTFRYPSQHIATFFEKTTLASLACWFAQQVQSLLRPSLFGFLICRHVETPKQARNLSH